MKNVYLLFTAMLFTMVLSSCKKDGGDDQERTVEYSIECPDCFVVYYDENGAQVSLQNQATGWSKTINGNAGGVVLLAAQNSSGSPAMVKGVIKLNGTILKENTSYCPISGTVIVTDTLQ